jgi:hypothetical protein
MIGLSYLRLAGYAAVCAAVLGAYFYVTHLQKEVKTLTADKQALVNEIAVQNDAIQRFKQFADDRVKAAEAELAKAAEETRKARAKATIIYRTAPSKPGDDCGSALDLINGGTK